MTPSFTCWLFDLDGCLVDLMGASSLRPSTPRLLTQLRDEGTDVRVWSAGGGNYAAGVLLRLEVADLVVSFHDKVRGDDGRWVLPSVVDSNRVVCIDDDPSGVPIGAPLIAVPPYIGRRSHDPTFERLLDHAGRQAVTTVAG